MANKIWQWIWQNELFDLPISLLLLFAAIIIIPGVVVAFITHSWLWALIAGLGGGGISIVVLVYILNKVLGNFN